MHAGARPAPSGAHAELARWASSGVPAQRTKLQVHTLSSNFRAATLIVSDPCLRPVPFLPGTSWSGEPTQVLPCARTHSSRAALRLLTAADCIRAPP